MRAASERAKTSRTAAKGSTAPVPMLVLAVDTGGTKCDALLVDQDGTVHGFGRYDHRRSTRGAHAGGRGRSREAVRTAVGDALAGAPRCAVLLTTTPVPLASPSYRSLGRPRIVRVPWSEWRAALSQAGEEYGLVALAGTGAFVFGLTQDGRRLHLDGLGPLLGDYGSGFHIGHLAIRAAGRATFGERHSTVLADAVPAALGMSSCSELVAFMQSNPDRSEVAALARVVNREAASGDRVARAILHEAADAMSETVRDIVTGLGVADEALPMVGTGSVATCCCIYWERLCERVAAFAPRISPVRLDRPAVLGVALQALGEHGVADMDLCRYNLFRTFDALAPEGISDCGSPAYACRHVP